MTRKATVQDRFYSHDVRYTTVPSALLQRGMAEFGLSTSQVVMLSQLLEHKWTAEHPFPSVQRLATRMNMTRQGVQKILGALEKKGWLRRIVAQGRRGANLYDLRPMFDKLYPNNVATTAADHEELPQAEAARVENASTEVHSEAVVDDRATSKVVEKEATHARDCKPAAFEPSLPARAYLSTAIDSGMVIDVIREKWKKQGVVLDDWLSAKKIWIPWAFIDSTIAEAVADRDEIPQGDLNKICLKVEGLYLQRNAAFAQRSATG